MLRARIDVIPHIRRLMQDNIFHLPWQPGEKCLAVFQSSVESFLRNFKALKHHNLLKQLVNSYEKLGCNISENVPFLHNHVNFFSENLEAWLKSKETPSTKILKQRRKDTRDAGIPTWWQSVVSAEKERLLAVATPETKTEKAISGLATMHYFLSWKKSMLSCLGNSRHFNAFRSSQSSHCKAIVFVYFFISVLLVTVASIQYTLTEVLCLFDFFVCFLRCALFFMSWFTNHGCYKKSLMSK